MAKIRGIKPEFWTDEKIVKLSMSARLFFVGLWNFSDDAGVFEWKPSELKMKIFPADKIDTQRLLRELVETSCVIKFSHEEKYFGYIPNFEEHQKPDKRFLKYLIDGFHKRVLPSLVETTTRPLRDHVDDIEGEGEVEGDKKKNIIKENEKGLVVKQPTPRELTENFFESALTNEEFKKRVKEYIIKLLGDYGNDARAEELLQSFVNYWTELTPSGKKKRWEKQTTFEVKRRLVTFAQNMLKKAGYGNQSDVRTEQQKRNDDEFQKDLEKAGLNS